MKTVLITGGTRGIGKAIAIKFAQNKYNLVLNYVNDTEQAEKLKKELETEYGVSVLLIKGDISLEETVKSILSKSLEKFDSIDVLVNNAGIAIDTTLEDKTVDNFRRILDVNLIGTFLTCKHIGGYMFNNQKGKIINITSTNGIDTYYPESMDYDASKAGVISLTKNFAQSYAPYTNVNAVACGWVNTDMNKDMDNSFKQEEIDKILLKRFAETYEIADVVYFLANEASYINGSVIRVDGGKDVR